MAIIVILWLFGILFYFLPSFLAKDRPQFLQVFLLNLFLGWTLLGWVIALIWSLNDKDEPEPPVVHVNVTQPETATPIAKPDLTPSSLPEQLGRLAELHRQGLLTDAEFERAKAQMLGG